MDQDNDGYVRIGAFIDPTGAIAGGEQVVGEVGKIAVATEAASESQEKLAETAHRAAEVLGSLRTAHHALAGIKELAEGGTAAIGGLAAEGRVATEIFEGMLGPIAPLLLVITTLSQLAIPMVEKMQEQAEKVKETKDNTGDLKDAAEGYKRTLDATLDQQKQLEESEKRQLEIIKAKQDMEKALVAFRREAAIEQARNEYLLGNKPGMSDEELKKRKQQFEATKADITDQSDVATSRLTVDNKKEDLDEAAKTLAASQAAQKELQRQLQAAQDATAAAKNLLAANRITLDKDGKPMHDDGSGKPVDISEEADKNIEAEQKRINEDRRHVLPESSPLANDANRQLRRELDARQAEVDKQRQSLAELRNAIRDVPQYATASDPKDANSPASKIKELDGKISSQEDKIDQLQQSVEQATKESALAQKKADDNKIDRTQTSTHEQDAEDQKKLRAARDNELKARQDAIETKLAELEKAKATPEQLAPYQKQQADLQKEANTNKANDELNIKVPLPTAPEPPAAVIDPRLAALQAQFKELEAERERALFGKGPGPISKDQEDIVALINARLAPLQKKIDGYLAGPPAPKVTPVAPTPKEVYDKSVKDVTTAENKKIDATTDKSITKAEETEAHKALAKQVADQKKEIEELKKRIAARPDHTALEPLVKSAEAIADPAQEVAALQAIMAGHISTLAEVATKLNAATKKNTADIAANTKKINALKDGVK